MKTLLAVASLVSISSALAQTSTAPFGIPMGTTIAQLQRMGATYDADANAYIVRNPPVKNSAFEYVLVMAGKSAGVCKIVAIGKDISTSSYGDQLRSEFSAFNNILNGKYGTASKKFDFLKVDSIWDEPRDFMMGLRTDDRYLDYYWLRSEGAKLNNNISIISLSGNATSTTNGYISVGYEYTNLQSCLNERSAKSGSGL